jgi:hypothetical protein
LLNELEQVLIRLDIDAVNRTIEAIRVYNPSLADALATVAQDFQFSQILHLIRSTSGETSQETQDV